jgi:hypothetical protein
MSGKHQKPLYAFAGDVFFTRSESVLGRLIRWAETDPGEEKTWANHTGVVVEDGWLVPPDPAKPCELAVVVEALWHVKKWEWWTAHKAEVLAGQRIKAFGPREPRTANEWSAFLDSAESFTGDRYGWWKLFAHLGDRALFKGKKVISKALFIDRRPICSYLAAVAQAAQGLGFGMEPRAATPDEMLDFCESRQGKAVWIER